MQLFEALQGFHNRLLVLVSSFVFNKHYGVDLHRMALYGSMLEFTGAICSLIRIKTFSGVPSLFRSFLESSVELENLLGDPDYIDNMNASHADQWLKVLKEARKGINPYLASIAEYLTLTNRSLRAKQSFPSSEVVAAAR